MALYRHAAKRAGQRPAGNFAAAGAVGTFTISVAAVPGEPVLLAATDSGRLEFR